MEGQGKGLVSVLNEEISACVSMVEGSSSGCPALLALFAYLTCLFESMLW